MSDLFISRGRIYATYLARMIILAGVVSVFFVSSVALAQNSGTIGGRPANPDPKNPRTKSIFVKTLKPGSTAADTVEIINGTDQPKKVFVYAADAVNSSGGAFACGQASDTPNAGGAWLDLERQSLEVPASGSVKLPFTITAPLNAEPGEQNACVILQEEKEQVVQGGIGLNFRTGIRVAILVPGSIIKDVSATGLLVKASGDTVTLTPQVRNNGTVSVDALVRTRLSTAFGTVIEAQDKTFPILRQQLTEWNIEFDQPFWGGFYKADYLIKYDKGDSFLGTPMGESRPVTVQGPSRWVGVWPAPAALLIEFIILIAGVFGVVYLIGHVQNRRAVAHHWVAYKVGTEQLQDIAELHHVSWKRLAKANNIKPPYQLKAGQTIKTPPKPLQHEQSDHL